MRELAHSGDFDVTIASPDFIHGSLRTLDAEIEADPPYKHQTLPVFFSKKIHLMGYRKLSRLIKKDAFDLVHIWEEPYVFSGFQIAKACVQAGIPYFFRTAQSLNKKYFFPFSYFEHYTLKHAKAWNAGASLVFNNLISRGYDSNKGVVISLGTDRKRFYPDAQLSAQARQELNLPGFVIGFSGRLVEAKGLDLLMEALLLVEAVKPGSWSFLALGSGPYKQKILDWASTHHLQDRVNVILAKHDEMPYYMRAMDVLVAPSQTTPSWREQFGRMIAESFATKVPVIGSNSGEIPFVIDDAGLVADEKDPNQWQEALLKLMNDEGLRSRLIEAGYNRFIMHYEVQALAQKYTEFYSQLLDQRS